MGILLKPLTPAHSHPPALFPRPVSHGLCLVQSPHTHPSPWSLCSSVFFQPLQSESVSLPVRVFWRHFLLSLRPWTPSED